MTEKVTLEIAPDGGYRILGGRTCDRMTPRELLLLAAARCAAETALMIMHKEQLTPRHFEITSSGSLTDEAAPIEPSFGSFHLVYRIECASEEEQAKAGRAVRLTQEKYCGMVRMLARIGPVTHETAVVTTQPAGV